MAVPHSSDSRSSPPVVADDDMQQVALFTTRPGRAVFTEIGNIDGWIATDLTVELRD